MSGFRRAVREIHRRSLWQVLGLYLAGSWVALQVVEQLTQAAGLPDWVHPFSLVLLVLGFPIVMATAFVQEGVGSSRAEGSGGAAGSSDSDARGADPSDEMPGEAPVAVGIRGDTARTGTGDAPGRLFTWRNAILGGGAAFALLGIATAGWMAMRALGIGPAASLVAAGVLDERSRIVLAEFDTRTGNEELAGSVSELLRVDFSQSQLVRVVEPTFVAAVLQRMELPAETRLDFALAREVALREGIPALITGEVNAAGTSYAISARLVAAEDGRELAAFRVAARDEADVIPAVDRLSKAMREKIGESLRDIRAEPPLERATTESLEALRKYTQALRATEVENDEERSIALLEEAVTLDPEFAMAWRKLGVVLSNNDMDRARWMRAFQRAYELRDRLTDRERYYTLGTYYTSVTNERGRAITAYENLLALYPDDFGALNNLGNMVWDAGDADSAAALFASGVAADSSASLVYGNLISALAASGRLEEAQETLDALAGRFPPSHFQMRFGVAEIAATQGDYEGAAEQLELMREERPGSIWQALTNSVLGALAATRGRLADAAASNRLAARAVADAGRPGDALLDLIMIARREALIAGRPAGALRELDSALERFPLASMDPLDRPYAELAAAYALAGRPERARALLQEFEADVDSLFRRPDADAVARARGNIALAEGRSGDAVRLMPPSDIRFCARCSLPALARAYEAAGLPDSAIAVHERFITQPTSWDFMGKDELLAPTHERLGELYLERGDLENAARHYAVFLELWAEADEELQSRVRAAQARLEEIVRERG